MGFFKKIFKAAKKVVKPITKIVKKVAKKVAKIGKSVMKGVSKISNKLGPLGMIAMSIAMPYALGGLSTFTNFASAYQGVGQTFLNAVGTVGNQIRLGYQAFNTGLSTIKSGITDTISRTFTKFAPKGTGNIFTNISQGARNLYTSAKNKFKSLMPKPVTAKGGTVEFFGAADPGVGIMQSTDAMSSIAKGTLTPNELGKQTLTESGGWFTRVNQAGVNADKLVTETINDAYKSRLEGYGPNARRMFDDIKSKAMQLDTYVNDEEIGSFVENNLASNRYSKEIISYSGDMDYTGMGTGNYKIKTEVPDLMKTKDYIDNGQGGYKFTGSETFKSPAVKETLTDRLKKSSKAALGDSIKSLLKPDATESSAVPYYGGDYSYSNLGGTAYSGTDVAGSRGGELVEKVYGIDAANKMRTYYKNMNIIADMGTS
jgi:hypothetical protein